MINYSECSNLKKGYKTRICSYDINANLKKNDAKNITLKAVRAR